MRLSLLPLLVISSSIFVWARDDESPASTQTTAPHNFKAGVACNRTIASRTLSTTATSKPTDTPDAKDKLNFPVGLVEDASWAKKVTALGDSYTAAIGVGQELDANARRYSGSYALIVRELLANPTKNPDFQFIAYSGAVSKEILDQVDSLDDHSQDLVLMTAGGNDALLTALLKACIYTPTNAKNCDDAISNSQKVISKDLRKNIRTLLLNLSTKMARNGLVVYTLYAQFFNAETEACNKRSMSLLEGIVLKNTAVFWTQDLRRKLNKLVVDANKEISDAIADMQEKVNIETVDWDPIAKANNGRFCEPGVVDKYRDEKNAGLLFNRLDVGVPDLAHRRRAELSSGSIERRKYTEKSHITFTFHPNPLGQIVIAGEVMAAIDRHRQRLASKSREPVCSEAEITEAKCLKRKKSIAQRESDSPVTLEKTIKDWCEKNKGVNVGEVAGGTSTDVDKRFATRFDYWYYSFWLSAEQRNLPGCVGAKLDKDDCTNRMTKAMAYCDPSSGDSHGFEINTRCLKYSVDIGESLAEDSPPWAAAEGDNCEKIDDGGTVDRQEFLDARRDWCKDPTKALDIPSRNEHLALEFKKNDKKCDDLTKDCETAVSHLWTRCADTPVRDRASLGPGISTKHGPLGGKGGTNGKCGHYSFKVEKKYSDAAKKVSTGTVAIVWHQRPLGLAHTRSWSVMHLDNEDGDYCKGNPGGFDTKGQVVLDDEKHPGNLAFPRSFAFKEVNNRDMAVGDWPCTYEKKGDKEAGTLKCEGWEDIACKSTSVGQKLHTCKKNPPEVVEALHDRRSIIQLHVSLQSPEPSRQAALPAPVIESYIGRTVLGDLVASIGDAIKEVVYPVGSFALGQVEVTEAGLSSAMVQLATSRNTGKLHGDVSRMSSV